MFDQMMNGFSWGVMMGVAALLVANAPVTLAPVLLAGISGSFWQGIKQVTQ